jgi:hypothetical protein
MSSILALAGGMKSHTSTPQWQVFETRMRQRHLERCLLQASSALESGALDAAKTLLAEARTVSPGDPEIDAWSRLVSSVPDSPRQRKCLPRAAAPIVALLGFGLGWGTAWVSTPEGAALFTKLAATATTVVMEVVKIATSAGVPQSV